MILPTSIYYELCKPGWGVGPDLTKNHILFTITSGATTYIIDDHRIPLNRGDVVYIPDKMMRCGTNESGKPHYMYVAHFRYEADKQPLPLLTHGEFLHVRPHNWDYLIQRFSLLTQYWLRKPAHHAFICHSVMLEMLALLAARINTRQYPPASHNLVMEVQDYIVNHYRERIRIKQLAKHVQRSPNYVSTLFRQVTGQTISEYTQYVRVDAARDLLLSSQMTIGEISDYLGFCEQSYFNKVFRKVTGFPPSALLKERVKIWR